MQRLRTIARGRSIWGNGRWLSAPEAHNGLGEVMGDSQGPKDGGRPLTCSVALSKAQISNLLRVGHGSRGDCHSP